MDRHCEICVMSVLSTSSAIGEVRFMYEGWSLIDISKYERSKKKFAYVNPISQGVARDGNLGINISDAYPQRRRTTGCVVAVTMQLSPKGYTWANCRGTLVLIGLQGDNVSQ